MMCYVTGERYILWCYVVLNCFVIFVVLKNFWCYNSEMKIEVVKEKRKTLTLKIIDGERAVVKAPSRLSDKKIAEFIESKKTWLAKNVQKIKTSEEFMKGFDFERFIYIDGHAVMPTSELAIGFDGLSKNKQSKIIKEYYLAQFEQLEKITKEISARTGLTYKELIPHNSVRVWGSYNSNRQMKLNYKLLMLPRNLVEYVICHELCHSLQMNHKPKFWAAVENICPNYRKLRQELNKFGFVLKRNI